MSFLPGLIHWAISSTVQTAVIVAIIPLIILLTGRHISPRWTPVIWMFVAFRLLLPWTPPNMFPLHLNNMNLVLSASTLHAGHFANSVNRASIVSGGGATGHSGFQSLTNKWQVVIFTVWIFGVFALGIRWLRREISFRRALSEARLVVDSSVVSTHPRIVIRETSVVSTPAVFGMLHPQILVPPGLIARVTGQEWEWILRHEISHVRRFDISARWVMELVTIAYWFNPFVWLARRQLRTTQELAADHAVVHEMEAEERRRYGRLLLNIATYERGAVPSMAGIKLRQSALATRLRQIRRLPNRKFIPIVTVGTIVLVLVTMVSVASMANAAGRSSLISPALPPTVTSQAQSMTTPANSTQGSIEATTFPQAINTFLSHQYSRHELANMQISGIDTAHGNYAAQVFIAYDGHLFMGSVVAVRRGSYWSFQFPSLSLSWIDPNQPMTVLPSSGQVAQTSAPYIYVSGVTQPKIQYVVIRFRDGSSVRIQVSSLHAFSYLSTSKANQSVSQIDAFSKSSNLVYSWS